MTIIAMDLGRSKSVCLIHRGGQAKDHYQTIGTDPQSVHDLLAAEQPQLVLLEIGPSAGWVCDVCQALGITAQVANTADERWGWKRQRNKSDRRDCQKLLKLHLLEDFPLVPVPAAAVRQWRQLIGYRKTVVEQITACKARVRSILEGQGRKLPSGQKAWTQAGLGQLRQEVKALGECGTPELWRGMVDLEVKHLDLLQAQLDQVDGQLDELAKADERVGRLQTAPGVGPRVAEAVVALIDQPERFGRGKQVGCWAGLTPRRWQSGQMEVSGHISHAGSALLAALLVQAAWSAVRQEGWAQAVFQRICGNSRTRRKLAIVAVARRLLVRLWAMLRDGTEWRDPRAVTASPKQKQKEQRVA